MADFARPGQQLWGVLGCAEGSTSCSGGVVHCWARPWYVAMAHPSLPKEKMTTFHVSVPCRWVPGPILGLFGLFSCWEHMPGSILVTCVSMCLSVQVACDCAFNTTIMLSCIPGLGPRDAFSEPRTVALSPTPSLVLSAPYIFPRALVWKDIVTVVYNIHILKLKCFRCSLLVLSLSEHLSPSPGLQVPPNCFVSIPSSEGSFCCLTPQRPNRGGSINT
jgi:hypothetical protein